MSTSNPPNQVGNAAAAIPVYFTNPVGGGFVGAFASWSALQAAYPAASYGGSTATAAGVAYVASGGVWVSLTVTVIQVTANVTINSANEGLYSGSVLEFTGAYTVTITTGRAAGFGFAAIPPATGNASIASDGTVLLQNGVTLPAALTTVTRAASVNSMFAVQQRSTAANTYIVSGN